MNEYIWAFDIGGTSIKYSLFENNENILTKSLDICQNVGGPDIIEQVKKVLDDFKITDEYGITISAPGVINTKNGEVIACSNTIKNYLGINYINELRKYSNRIAVDNDLNCAVIGEYGSRKNIASMYQINIGTGVGGAYIDNGKLIPGNNYGSGNIGVININGSPLDDTGSMRSLLNRIRSKDPSINNGKELVDKYCQGDKRFETEIEFFFDSICKMIFIVKHMLDPELIVIGGGVSESKSFVKDGIQNWSTKNGDKLLNTKIECARLGNNAGIYGALENYRMKGW